MLHSSAPGCECSKTKLILLVLQSFLNLCLVFHYTCPFSRLLLTHLLFHFSQQLCIIVLMQRV
jgi:hypothetical protein